MKTAWILSLVILVTAGWPTVMGAPLPTQMAAADAGRVLLVAKEYSDLPGDLRFMIEREVNPMIAQLTNAGYSVTVASQSGTNISAGSVQLNVSMKLSEVRVEDYVGIIVPCMAFGDRPIPQEAVEIVKAANRLGRPIAAQQSSALILGSAGVLKGRRYAIWTPYSGRINDGTYSGTGVVRDGNIVTSGSCPMIEALTRTRDGTEELVRVFMEMLKGF